jgi:Tfp pilus assembly protein PilO
MNFEALLGPLSRIPWILISFLMVGYFGWEYYDFLNSESSELNQEKARVVSIREDISRKSSKLKEVEQFRLTVDDRRKQILDMKARLEERKLAVSDHLDAAEFMGVLNAEIRRVGLDVVSLDPEQSTMKELYAAHPFKLSFRGVYVQFLVFLERLSKLQKIVRVDRFEVVPSARAQVSRSLVELQGELELKVYRYISSAADKVPDDISTPKSGAVPAGGTSAPGASAQSGQVPPAGEGN